ncbi:MAG: RHS repeat-associated core domain-containing protein [Leptospirales bacterium]
MTGTNADLEIELEYNSFGRCTGRHDSDGPAWNYEYDVQDQLTGAQKTSGSGPDYELSIRYDASGNRVEENGAPKTYDEFRELLESDAEFNYAYDVLGNLIQKTSLGDGSVAAYTYDDFDRLIKFELRAADDTLVRSGSYAYDPQGRRIRKTVQEAAGTPATTYCIYDGPNLFLELDAAFEVRRSYVNLRTIDSLLGFVEGDRAFYFLRGKFNTVEAVYDDTGELRARYIYGPFGDLLGEAANINNDILFANREFDRESGLYFNRARHYDARAGRVLQPDPAQGSFRDPRTLVYSYAYAANNPLRYYDPTGFSFWDDLWKGITNVAGAIWDVIKYIGKTIWNLTKLVVGVLLNPWVLIDLTWGGFGTALGMIIGAGAILLGGEAEIVWGKGVKVVYPDWIRDLLPEKNRRSAFSLGPVVIGSSSFNNWDHEFGHTWQNRILGPLYIPVIAIPSFISAATNTPAEHRNQWYERWADDLADWENSGGVQAWGGA